MLAFSRHPTTNEGYFDYKYSAPVAKYVRNSFALEFPLALERCGQGGKRCFGNLDLKAWYYYFDRDDIALCVLDVLEDFQDWKAGLMFEYEQLKKRDAIMKYYKSFVITHPWEVKEEHFHLMEERSYKREDCCC